jgi:hypothetical protein
MRYFGNISYIILLYFDRQMATTSVGERKDDSSGEWSSLINLDDSSLQFDLNDLRKALTAI